MTIHRSDEEDKKRERIVREAQPKKKPLEYGEETRYGREIYGNARYNEALDEYEAAPLKRLAEESAPLSRPEPPDERKKTS